MLIKLNMAKKIIVKVKPTDRKGKPGKQDSFPREIKFARNPSGMPHHFDWPEKWHDNQFGNSI